MVAVHRSLGNSFPIVPVTYDITIVMGFTVSILVIEYEGHGIVGIIIYTVLYSIRHHLLNNRIRIKWNKYILIVNHRTELVFRMTLYLSVSTSYDQGNLHDRSVAALEILSDRRFHPELPRIVAYLLEMSLFLSCSPVCRNEHPVTLNNNSKMAIQLTGVAIQRIIWSRIELDGAWLVCIRAYRIHLYSRSSGRIEFTLFYSYFSCTWGLVYCQDYRLLT